MLRVLVALLCAQHSAAFVAPGRPLVVPSVAPAARCAASPQMMFGGSRRTFFRALKSVKPRMPNLPGKGWSGPGMNGGDGGDTTPAPESSDDGDEGGFAKAILKKYQEALDDQPLLTKAFTSFMGFTLGDILAQTCIQKNEVFDWARLARLSTFGFLVHGTTSHWFYGILDGRIPGTSAPAVFTKVFIDQVLWNPIFGVMFFSYVAGLEGKGPAYVKDKVQKELLVSVMGSWKVWPIAHAINFRFISSDMRVLYINSIQIGYNCFLSLISNRAEEEAA